MQREALALSVRDGHRSGESIVPTRGHHSYPQFHCTLSAQKRPVGQETFDAAGAGRAADGRAVLLARGAADCWPQAVEPRATTLSARRSLSPYMKWFFMFSENRLASVVSPTASATSRMCIGVAPQHTPM